MTLPTSSRVSDVYTTNGTQKDFSFGFRVFYDPENGGYGLEVRRQTVDGYEIIPKSQYDVIPSSDSSSGIIRFYTAPVAGLKIYIAGFTEAIQQLDLTNYGRYSAESIETQFDYITAIIQEWISSLGEETRQRIAADEILNQYVVQRIDDFVQQVNQNWDAKNQQIEDYIASIMPSFTQTLREEIEAFAVGGMQDAIDQTLADSKAEIDDAVARANAAALAAAITGKLYDTPEAGVDPVTGVSDGAYFNVRSSSDESYIDEYQNVGGSAVSTGRSYSSSRVVVLDSVADLLALPEGRRKEGFSYTVRGSVFRWDAGRFVPQGRVSVRAFGATGSGDDTAACQAALDFMRDYAASQTSPVQGGRPVVTFDNSPTGRYPTTDTLVISRLIDVDMSDAVIYSGPADRPAMVHGEPGQVVWMPKSIYRVSRPTAIWKDAPKERGTETDIGLVLYNFNTANQCLIAMASRFEIGFQAAGSGGGFAYNHISLGYLIDNKVQQWNYSEANGWCNENSWYGGRFSRQTSVVGNRSCTGIRSLGASTSDSGHNSNTWYSPSFEQLGKGIDGTVPVIDGENLTQCRILNFRDENNGPLLLREGANAWENELTPSYGSLINYRSKIDDSASPSPSTLVSWSPRLKYYDAHTQLVWDSGDIVQKACHVDGGRINVAGMVGAVLATTANPMGSSYIADGNIVPGGVTYPNRALGVFLEMPARDFDTTLIIRLLSNPLGEARPVLVCFDENFVQIDALLHPSTVRTRQGHSVIPNNLLGGSFGWTYASTGVYYMQIAKTVKYLAVYAETLNLTSALQRLQIHTQPSMMPIRAFVPYDELVTGMNIGKAPPTTGNSKLGKIILNSEPTAGSPYGWRCIESGNPGVWEELAFSTPAPPPPEV